MIILKKTADLDKIKKSNKNNIKLIKQPKITVKDIKSYLDIGNNLVISRLSCDTNKLIYFKLRGIALIN